VTDLPKALADKRDEWIFVQSNENGLDPICCAVHAQAAWSACYAEMQKREKKLIEAYGSLVDGIEDLSVCHRSFSRERAIKASDDISKAHTTLKELGIEC